MEPNRFDDVEFRIMEEPEPAPRRVFRLGHATLAAIAALALAGSLAAGASALTSTAEAPTRHVAKPAMLGHHGPCHRGEGADYAPAARY
jgi:hypothetical protein